MHPCCRSTSSVSRRMCSSRSPTPRPWRTASRSPGATPRVSRYCTVLYCTVLYNAGLQDIELAAGDRDKGGKEVGEEAAGNGVTKEAPGGGYSVNYKVHISCGNMIVTVMMLLARTP